MITIRLMREEDADAVREVDAVAFWTWEKQLKGEAAGEHRQAIFASAFILIVVIVVLNWAIQTFVEKQR
jgi:ABC-type phosphate transport system permease subunit